MGATDMKIWFDLSNSPHINLFRTMIRELQADHDVIITCRPLANTIDLLNLHGLEHTVVGIHYGKSLLSKVAGYPVRVAQLRRFLAPHKVDVAVSQSSFHSPLVARLLGVRSLYLNDNEHALGNVPAFACATRIMVPEFFSAASLRRQHARRSRVIHYPGLKEGVYLWECAARIGKLRKARRATGRRTVYFRPEPWTAQYYSGARNVIDAALAALKDKVGISILPRSPEQAAHYSARQFEGVRVIREALDVEQIAPACDLFIGAGGTMTREMAVLGIPTISVYQDCLLDVDRYLLEREAFLHRPHLSADEALAYLHQSDIRPPDQQLLEKGRAAYRMIKHQIEEG